MIAFTENLQSSGKFLSVGLLSIALHLAFFSYTSHLAQHFVDTNFKNFVPLQITLEDTPSVEIKKEDIVPPKPKNSVVKKSAVQNSIRKKAKAVKPIQGLPPEALPKTSTGIAVPVGNTTMTEDEGTRLDEVKTLPSGEDLSSQPIMIRSSVETPEYTQDALENNVVGTFTIDVYVDESGEVKKAELQRKIGYGMDERIITAAKKVHFVPGKDSKGKEIGGWTQIKFRLEIP